MTLYTRQVSYKHFPSAFDYKITIENSHNENNTNSKDDLDWKPGLDVRFKDFLTVYKNNSESKIYNNLSKIKHRQTTLNYIFRYTIHIRIILL